MSKLETNTIDNISGSSTLNLGDTNATNITIDNGVTTLDFGTGISTISNMPAAFKNTPAVSAYMSSSQTVTDNTHTKIQYNTELYDTDSAYDNSTNYRFTVPSGKAGKYFIHAECYQFGNNNDEKMREIDIYLNGSRVRRHEVLTNYSTGQSSGGSVNISGVLDLSVSDYIEIFGRIDVNSGTPSFYGASGEAQRYSILEIFRLVE